MLLLLLLLPFAQRKLVPVPLEQERAEPSAPFDSAERSSPSAAQAPGQAGSGCSRLLFGQPLAAVCGEDGTLPRPIQELLAVLQREGPSTEGIFRRAAGATALRELREALERGAEVELGSQPALLLAVVLKDFLRSIPGKLLVSELYEDWMAALQKSSKEEKISELQAVAEKLPAANLLLLKRLLRLLQHIGHNAATSRMSCSNLAICIGPNLLSPPEEDLLPLEALLEVTEKVKVLVEFLMENCRELFGEESAEPRCAAGEEWPAPVPRCRDVRLEEQGVPAGTAAAEQEAEGLPHAGPSPLGVLSEAGGERVVACETGEVVSCQLPTPPFLLEAPPALPPSSPESAADSLGCPQEPASLSEERRFAGCAQDKAKRRKRKSKQAWGEESARRAAKKRRKREAVLADGAVQRRRKAQQALIPCRRAKRWECWAPPLTSRIK
ncbi:T-cell activation Rho GTPase-activating protein-like [Gymnogyps californianus]|uniref:T-cell activation Rho GTPase-activating protein-like n=1 Tax=Gymnogyps californianus TaxID=33616 RepID=UPI0021C62B24|nr:T-cell activation Rho GTPase-activating protein-like [Gymnogyps californianus]